MRTHSSEKPFAMDVERRIGDALVAHGADAGRRVWVTINGSQVRLHGSVRSPEELRQTKRAAGESADVERVLSLVELRP
jgi:osmotically-inducible protein OsmY